MDNRTGQRVTERLEEMVETIVANHGLDLIELAHHRSGRRQLVRVFVDKVGGVTVAECESVSRRLAADLDADDVIEGRYTLEVSSPGLDRPLKTPADFRRKTGRKVELRYNDDTPKRQSVKGIIENVDDASVVVGSTTVQWTQVIEGKLII